MDRVTGKKGKKREKEREQSMAKSLRRKEIQTDEEKVESEYDPTEVCFYTCRKREKTEPRNYSD